MDFENVIAEINYYDDIDFYDDILWPLRFRLPKIYIRDLNNPFELPLCKLQKRYRFSQDSVLHIVGLIRCDLVKPDNRGLPVKPEIALLLCLRFYATGSFQVSTYYVKCCFISLLLLLYSYRYLIDHQTMSSHQQRADGLPPES